MAVKKTTKKTTAKKTVAVKKAPAKKKVPVKKTVKKTAVKKATPVKAEIIPAMSEEEVLESVGSHVRTVTKFEQTVLSMEEMVEKSKSIKVTDLTDEKQLKIAKESRIALRAVEISIEKRGLGYRKVFSAINSEILVKERELKAITSSEIERLEKIETEAKELAIRTEREKKLPERKSRIEEAELNFFHDKTDDELLEMDSHVFESYFIELSGRNVEHKKFEAEEAQRKADEQEEENKKEAKRLQKEKDDAEREKEIRKEEGQKAKDDAKEATENKVKERNDKRHMQVTGLGLQYVEEHRSYVLEDFNVALVELQTMTDDEWAGLMLKIKTEQERRVEAESKAEDQAKLEKQNAYRKWRADLGFSQETRDDFKEEKVGESVVLWKRVGVFEIN